MIFEAEIGGREIRLDVRRTDGWPHVEVAGHTPHLDLVRLSPWSYSLLVDGQSHLLSIRPGRDGLLVELRRRTYSVRLRNELELTVERLGLGSATHDTSGTITAPIPGLVSAVAVAVGDEVASGAQLLVLEAMKMENDIAAPSAGLVQAVHVQPGETVEKGAPLLEIAPL